MRTSFNYFKGHKFPEIDALLSNYEDKTWDYGVEKSEEEHVALRQIEQNIWAIVDGVPKDQKLAALHHVYASAPFDTELETQSKERMLDDIAKFPKEDQPIILYGIFNGAPEDSALKKKCASVLELF
ncbi:MAG: hypothetical protein COB36_03970 [Alphaproteobacteria bacterium]|nr:MAG: hypothetical protein COB36_03970 [Alphaproteobacteria bacterium]